jgi:biotin synthase-like enzyme
LSKENIKKATETAVESMIIGNMLTTIGIEPEEDIKMVHKLNKKIKK